MLIHISLFFIKETFLFEGKFMIKKYIFLYENKRIYTYSFFNNSFDLKKNDGEDFVIKNDFLDSSFINWLEKIVSETKEDTIDFCVISDTKISENSFDDKDKRLKWKKLPISTWNLDDISNFLFQRFPGSSFELIMRNDDEGVNLGNQKVVRKIYVSCFPNFDFSDTKKMSIRQRPYNNYNENLPIVNVDERPNVIVEDNTSIAEYISKKEEKQFSGGYKPQMNGESNTGVLKLHRIASNTVKN